MIENRGGNIIKYLHQLNKPKNTTFLEISLYALFDKFIPLKLSNLITKMCFRSSEYYKRYEYVSVDLQNPRVTPGNNAS